MKKQILASAVTLVLASQSALSATEIEQLRQEMTQMKQDYEKRLELLEKRLQKAESSASHSQQTAEQAKQAAIQAKQTALKSNTETQSSSSSASAFNPAISVILDGRYADFDNDPGNYEIPGFALGGESGLGEQGFSIGHTEVTASANIDDKFFGQVTAAIHDHDGETEVELEEAFAETTAIGHGVSVKVGRFLSGIGYLNQQHEHVWDFADAPLIYRGLFGNQLRDDGIQMRYVAPTDMFLELGGELLRGDKFPTAGNDEGVGAWSIFANIGGDWGVEHSWQAGLSHWQSDVDGRTGAAHGHGHEGEEEHMEIPSFTGESKINSAYVVYKWAPNGNAKQRNLKLQFEYFDRREDGDIHMLEDGAIAEQTSYDGKQSGWYAQAIYQFMPSWRVGARYDLLDSDNRGADEEIIEEAGLSNEGIRPKRYSAMVEWLPSEFSRVRLQFNQDRSYDEKDNQVFLQYTHSFGSHGGHQY